MSNTKEVMRRAVVAALREIVAGLDDDAILRRSEQAELSAASDATRALQATEALRKMLRACVADAMAYAGNVTNVDTWAISISVANVRAFLAATDAKEGAR